jgi:glutamate 5-kinase
VGTGGFATKLAAARLCGRFGIAAVVAGGDEPGVVERVLAGEALGTLFVPAVARKARARQRWLAGAARSAGTIVVDAGAERAITTRNASLLPGGVVGVAGGFERDQTVEIVGPSGRVLARGLAAYSAQDVQKIMGLRASRIEQVLGYCYSDEVVHRSDMALVDGARREDA